MLDNWSEILAESLNAVKTFENLEARIAPELERIDREAEGVDPELLRELDKARALIKSRKAEYNKVKQDLEHGTD